MDLLPHAVPRRAAPATSNQRALRRGKKCLYTVGFSCPKDGMRRHTLTAPASLFRVRPPHCDLARISFVQNGTMGHATDDKNGLVGPLRSSTLTRSERVSE